MYAQPRKFFGIEDKWVTKQEKVKVSNPEKTVIDALMRPELCGGITEIAKGIWLKKHDLNYQKLLNYSRRIKVKAVAKRLGFILEVLNLSDKNMLAKLKIYIKEQKTSY